MAYNPSSVTSDKGAVITQNKEGGKNIVLSPVSKEDKARYVNEKSRGSKHAIPTKAFEKKKLDDISGEGLLMTTNEKGGVSYVTAEARFKMESERLKGFKSAGEYVSQERNTFYNDKGEGVSMARDLAVKNVEYKPYGQAEVTYYDDRKEQVSNTGRVPVYNKTISEESRLVKQIDRRNLFQKGISNLQLVSSESQKTMSDIEKKYPKGTAGSGKDIVTYYKAGVYSFGSGVVLGITTPLIYPKETIKQVGRDIVDPKGFLVRTKGAIQENPSSFTGQLVGGSLLAKGIKSSSGVVREGFIGLTSKTVKATKYLDPETMLKVEKDITAFPLTKDIKSSVIEFNKGLTKRGTVKVLSASDRPITTQGWVQEIASQNELGVKLSILQSSRKVVIGEGSPELINSRTTGLYVAPSGRGSPYFFRIMPSQSYGFSILPKLRSRPTLTVGEVSGVKRIPSSILKKGVQAENIYLQKAPKGYAYITGNVEARFNPKFDVGGRFKTSESEAVINVGSVGRNTAGILGYKESFIFKGRRVPVRELSFVDKGDKSSVINVNNPFISRGKSVIVNNEYRYYSPKSSISLSGQLLKSSVVSKKYSSYPSSKKYNFSSIVSRSSSPVSRVSSIVSRSSSPVSRVSSIVSRSSSSITRIPLVRYPIISSSTFFSPRKLEKYGKKKKKKVSLNLPRFKQPKRRLDILSSLREVNIYEAETGREAGRPKKTARIKRIFEGQYYGKGYFNVPIPVLKRK